MKRKWNLKRQTVARLRLFCHKLSEKERKAAVLVAFALFAAGCLYMTVSSVSEFGTGRNGLDAGHISPLELKEDSR